MTQHGGSQKSIWRERIHRLDADAEFHQAATERQVATLEADLRCALPEELRELLFETNGAEIISGLQLVWSAEEIARRNREMRDEWRTGGWLESYMPVDHLLFFGDHGNGDLYFVPVTAEGTRPDVFVWDHEDDSRTWSASSLNAWLSGAGRLS